MDSSAHGGPSVDGGTLTALQKPDGLSEELRIVFRTLVAKYLARQFAKTVESVCSPFQFALSTRAGTDCVGHTIRALIDEGAYDHVCRSAMLSKLLEVPALHICLRFGMTRTSCLSHNEHELCAMSRAPHWKQVQGPLAPAFGTGSEKRTPTILAKNFGALMETGVVLQSEQSVHPIFH